MIGVFVLGAVATPYDAPFMMLILSGPLMLLYEFGILLSVLVRRGRDETESRSDPPGGSVAFMLALAAWKSRGIRGGSRSASLT